MQYYKYKNNVNSNKPDGFIFARDSGIQRYIQVYFFQLNIPTLIANTSRAGTKTRKSEHFLMFGLFQYGSPIIVKSEPNTLNSRGIVSESSRQLKLMTSLTSYT